MTMRVLLLLGFATILAATAPAAAAGDDTGAPYVMTIPATGASEHRSIAIDSGKTLILDLPADAKEILVSQPDIVEAIVRTPRRLYLMAHKTGSTNAFVFGADGRRLLSLDIRVGGNTGDLAEILRQELPEAKIKVIPAGSAVVLTGTVEKASDVQLAQKIAEQFVGQATKVVNVLGVTGTEQVMLKVRIAEVQRSVSKQLGIDLTQSSTTLGATILSAGTSNPFGIVGSALSDSSQVALSNGNLSATMKALETVGLMHTLAEPNLVAVSGETAKFLAGGEFPVASGRDSSGNVSITFKQYGVGLAFTPVVLGPGRISLQLSTEVSELTNTGALTVSTGATSTSSNTDSSSDDSSSYTTTIPALSVRRAETSVELPSGGSFAIAGLMQHTTKQQIDGFPGLKDLPILGALFRSRDFQNDETELVVLVTAYLVRPVKAAQLTTPTEGFVTPTDPETLLLGRLNAVYKKDQAPMAPEGDVGFIVK